MQTKSAVIFCFSGFASSPWNIRHFLNLKLESSIFRNIRSILRVGFFSSLESYFLKYKRNLRIESSISGYITNFLISELESYISRNIKKCFRADFFYFFEVGFEGAPGSCILYYSPNNFHSSIKFSHQFCEVSYHSWRLHEKLRFICK